MDVDIIQRASFSAAVKTDIPFTFHLGMRTSIYGWRDSHKQIPAPAFSLDAFSAEPQYYRDYECI